MLFHAFPQLLGLESRMLILSMIFALRILADGPAVARAACTLLRAICGTIHHVPFQLIQSL